MDNDRQLITPAIDLLAPPDRFESSSRLHGRLQRSRLLVRRFWWVIGLVFVFVLVPVYFFSAELPPAYKSKARLWLTGRLNISEGRLYTEELMDYLATQTELLRSSTVQQRALAKLREQYTNGLPAAVYHGTNGFGPMKTLVGLVKSLAGRSTTNALDESFPFSVKVNESSKSSTLELQATGSDRGATTAYLNCLIEEYLAFKKETREKAFNQTLASVNSQAVELRRELKSQREKLHAFQSSNNVVFLQEQGSSAASYLASLNKQIATLRTQLQLLQRLDPEQWIDVESRRRDMNSGEPGEASGPDTLAGLAGPQTDLFKARQQMQLLKAKRDELSRFLRPLHPKILKLNEEIATQEKIIEVSREETIRQLENRRQALQLQVTNLEAAFEEWDSNAIASSRKIADYDNLRLDLQRLQNADDRMLGVIQTVDVSKTVDQENVGVLQRASTARPVPRMAINLLLATLAAMALSFVVLYCVGMFDDRFVSPIELAGYLSEPVLGQIPAIPLKPPAGELDIQFLERQRFEFVESFRNLRSALLFMRNGETRPKTILISSSLPREGKSTIALYLAATMAIARSRVLLIDADMRRPALHKFLAFPPGPGLAEVLSGEILAEQAIVSAGLENLFVLRAGRAKRNPGELVLSPEWPRLIAELRGQFDYVLIDSPPLLATDDTPSFAPLVDGVLMIVRGAFTSARMARRGLDLLRQRGAHVLGLVFNRATTSANGYHYYRHFRNEYHWDPQPSKRISMAEARQQ
jgi:capsular exopolysaccharide synthesis family protein